MPPGDAVRGGSGLLGAQRPAWSPRRQQRGAGGGRPMTPPVTGRASCVPVWLPLQWREPSMPPGDAVRGGSGLLGAQRPAWSPRQDQGGAS